MRDRFMKKFLLILCFFIFSCNYSLSASLNPVSGKVKLPNKYTQDYVDTLELEYKKVTNEQILHVALDMMKDSSAEFSRKAILGYNLTQKPIKIEFKDLSELNPAYASFDAVGWKKKNKLYPESNNLESPLVMRENILKQLLEKGNYTDKYIKKTVYANEGYKDLPLTSPGFNGS